MADSCCICGLVLATNDSNSPQWCKEIRALYISDGIPVLSDIGSLDNDALPLNFGLRRFRYRRSSTVFEDSLDDCYPFHAACWSLFQESYGVGFLENEIAALFKIFEGFHYNNKARAFKWGQGYYFEDMIDFFSHPESRELQDDILAVYKDIMTYLADPLHFELQKGSILEQRTMSSDQLMVKGAIFVSSHHPLSRSRHSPSQVLSLPPEIFESILFNLDFDDVKHLLNSSAIFYRRYGRDGINLPSLFWESRFWAQGEMSFMRASRPQMYSWKELYFKTKSELRGGPSSMNLRNRKRIWKLGVELSTLVRAVNEPSRVLAGTIVPLLPNHVSGPTASCLALKYDSEGCRELKQVYVSLKNINSGSKSCALSQCYVLVSSMKFLSGVTFIFKDGNYVDVGYVKGEDRDCTSAQLSTVSPKFLWVVFSPSGFVAMTFDTCSQEFLDTCVSSHGNKIAVARWSWDRIQGLYVGLDATRIVRITIDVSQPSLLDDLAWTPILPPSIPSINQSDILALHKFQRESFSPVSTISIEPQKGQLAFINVYSTLGPQAGISGVQFVYKTGAESFWGSSDDAASLTFFLHKTEHLIKVKIYKINSLTCHLQFFTNFNRTSNVVPQLQKSRLNVPMECIEHSAARNGHITGFCGYFSESRKQLNFFGVLATNPSIALTLPWSISEINESGHAPQDIFLGMASNLGVARSHHLILNKYHSVQASINPTASRYRDSGQVTGLVFRLKNHECYPDLIGQWTGTGTTYVLEADEQIMDLEVITTSPRHEQFMGPTMSQVQSVTIVTSLRKLRWGRPSTVVLGEGESVDLKQRHLRITEIIWDFNVIFDRVECIYNESRIRYSCEC